MNIGIDLVRVYRHIVLGLALVLDRLHIAQTAPSQPIMHGVGVRNSGVSAFGHPTDPDLLPPGHIIL